MVAVNRKRIKEYDIIRVLATVLVIIGHCGYYSMITEYGGIIIPLENDSMIHTGIEVLVRMIYVFHMPLFFALSGATFCISNSKKNYKSIFCLIKDKGKRLIIPFFILSICYVIPIKYSIGYFDLADSLYDGIVKGQFLLMGNSHLWFLLSLFWITIICWLIFKTIKKERARMFLIILIYIFGNLIDFKFLGINEALRNLIWFYLGYLLSEHRLQINRVLKKHILVYISCCVALIFVIGYVYLFWVKNNIFLYNIVSFLFIILIYLFAITIKWRKLLESDVFNLILHHSFFIYLFSDPLNYIVLYIIKTNNLCIFLDRNSFALLVFFTRIVVSIVMPILVSIIWKECKQSKWKYESKY